MRHFGIALVIAFGLAGAIFGLAYPLVGNAHIAEGLAAIPVTACHHIAELLERRDARNSLGPSAATAIASYHSYGLAWPLMIVYGTVVLFAAIQLASGLGGLIGIAAYPDGNATPQQLFPILAIMSILGEIVAGFFVGRWIGARSASHGIIVLFAVAVCTTILLRGLEPLLMSPADFQAMYGNAANLPFLAFQAAVLFAILLPGMFLGYWRGRKRRFLNYLHYLLAVLPPATSNVLVDLAYEEAQKAGARHAAPAHQ